MKHNCWLPKLEEFSDYNGCWAEYQDALYGIFKKDFIDDKPYFEEQIVNIRREPMALNKEEAFFHITCQDYYKDGERILDLRRAERIRWVRAFIEKYHCNSDLCEECDGVKVWREPYKTTERVHLLLEEEKYMVVVEKRKNYYLLITAFYFNYNHALEKKLKHYYKYKEQIS